MNRNRQVHPLSTVLGTCSVAIVQLWPMWFYGIEFEVCNGIPKNCELWPSGNTFGVCLRVEVDLLFQLITYPELPGVRFLSSRFWLK